MSKITENTRGQDIHTNKLSVARKKALARSIRKADITDDIKSTVSGILPYMNKAVKYAENNPKNFGVLSEDFATADEANNILNNSIRNNYIRWLLANKPGTFVDFMRDRWAPIGAENDPTGLNPYWNDNVRKSLRQQLGPETYNSWEAQRLARVNAVGSMNAFS